MAIHARRLQRMRDLVDWVERTKGAVRYDSLAEFAKLHKVSYGTIKADVYALAYASMPGPRGYDIKSVPKQYKKDFKGLRELFKKQEERGVREEELNIKESRIAGRIFLSHIPLADIERINRLYKIEDPQILEKQRKIVDNIRKAAESKALTWMHPVRAYSSSWLEIGEKIHFEILEAIKKAPKNKLDAVVRNIWEANVWNSEAKRRYAEFRGEYIKNLSTHLKQKTLPTSTPKFLRARKEFINRYMKGKWSPERYEEVWQRFVSDYKNLRRYYKLREKRPSKESMELKKTLKSMYASLPKEGKLHVTMIKDPFMRTILLGGERLTIADKMYTKAKEIEEKKITPFVKISKTKKVRRRRR